MPFPARSTILKKRNERTLLYVPVLSILSCCKYIKQQKAKIFQSKKGQQNKCASFDFKVALRCVTTITQNVLSYSLPSNDQKICTDSRIHLHHSLDKMPDEIK